MKTKKLKTAINHRHIFKMSDLAYHTKCILSKMVTDFLYGKESIDFIYLQENIFGTWPEEVVVKALDELGENDIMILCNCDHCEDDGEECDNMQVVFNPDFLNDACPYLDHCSCCNPAPANFNVIYN